VSSPESVSTAPFASFVEDNLAILGQAVAFVRDLQPEQYGRPHPELGLSSIGSHLRHILDFYARFLEAMESPSCGTGLRLVDYDRRERNPQLETDPAFALEFLDGVRDRLHRLPLALAGLPLEVKTDSLAAGESFTSRSSVDRELQAMLSHTVHHYALIKIAAGRVGVDPGRGFGVAPSTLRYWEQSGACAP